MRAEARNVLLLEDETVTDVEPLLLSRGRGLLARDHERRILERSEVRRVVLSAIREGVQRSGSDLNGSHTDCLGRRFRRHRDRFVLLRERGDDDEADRHHYG